MKYAAFLRAINVGKKNTIKKDVLQQFFLDQGCKQVKTFLQTGNVSFSYEKNPVQLVDDLEKRLLDEIGEGISVMIREFDEMKTLIESNPFGDVETPEDEIWYMTFIRNQSQVEVPLPLIEKKKGISVIKKMGLNLFSIRKRIDGVVGATPNALIEKEFKIISTNRSWKTILRFIK